MEQRLPVRKSLRIPQYDYSQANVYFLTACTKGRQPLFWQSKTMHRSGIPLSDVGIILKARIEEISQRYEMVIVEKYCIMPDHIHLLLSIHNMPGGRPMVAPTISQIMQQLKGAVSKQLGHSIWQKSFYDHVVRQETDFLSCWQYIENTPLKYEVM